MPAAMHSSRTDSLFSRLSQPFPIHSTPVTLRLHEDEHSNDMYATLLGFIESGSLWFSVAQQLPYMKIGAVLQSFTMAWCKCHLEKMFTWRLHAREQHDKIQSCFTWIVEAETQPELSELGPRTPSEQEEWHLEDWFMTYIKGSGKRTVLKWCPCLYYQFRFISLPPGEQST